MHSIKKAKIDALLTQFQHQLLKDSQIEEKRIREALEECFNKDVNRLEAEKKANVKEIE